MKRAWCDDCKRMREVVDEFAEDTGDSRVTVETYYVTAFDCGHSKAVTTDTYPSPLKQAGLPRSYALGARAEWD